MIYPIYSIATVTQWTSTVVVALCKKALDGFKHNDRSRTEQVIDVIQNNEAKTLI